VPSISRRLPSLVGAIVLAATLLPLAAPPVAAEGGSTFVSIVNDYRDDAGLGPVALHAAIDQIAVERGKQVARNGLPLTHDLAYVQRRFDALGICYTNMGEVLAHTTAEEGDYARFVYRWSVSKSGHREIMLGSFTHAGGSRERGADGTYAVMIFATLCGASSGGFTDVGGSAFISDIRWLVGERITAGCATNRYCPRSPVTREQMASFLRRASGIPASAVNAFVDDNSSMHESDINGVAAAEITGGCTSVRYCPGSVVTRAQMASFLSRALQLPSATRDWFRDDNGSMHEAAINRLAEAGITGGCASGTFCPDASVTREQMAGFLHRAFGS
jgi:hypothetical protein